MLTVTPELTTDSGGPPLPRFGAFWDELCLGFPLQTREPQGREDLAGALQCPERTCQQELGSEPAVPDQEVAQGV